MSEYPGAVMPVVTEQAESAFAPFEIVLRVTGGITLSQLCELTGLEPSTVQNWVKRGWVPAPNGKRYGEQHLARVLLLNIMRHALPLESIIDLLHYVNGNLNDPNDDSIPDRALYDLLCRAIVLHDEGASFEQAAQIAMTAYEEPWPGAADKIRQVLTVMLPAHLCTRFKRETEYRLNHIRKHMVLM